jgi:hypothetical protein
MLRMGVYMHSRFVENHPIRILEDRPFISEVVLSQPSTHGSDQKRVELSLPTMQRMVALKDALVVLSS